MNVKVIDEHITENDHSTTKVDTITSQCNILDNPTTINDDKDYACDLNILISDSDTVRIHYSRLNFDKESEQGVIREYITGIVIKEKV